MTRVAVFACLVALAWLAEVAAAGTRQARWVETTTSVSEAVCPVADDFNGDGRQDLLTGRFGSLQLWPGRRDGRFGRVRRSSGGAELLCPAAAGDFNEDGRLDVVGTASDVDEQSRFADRLFVALGGRRGRFRERDARVPDRLSIHDVAAADLDRDGDLDIAVLEHELAESAPLGQQERLRIGLGNGRGRFVSLPRLGPFASPRIDELATSVAVTDVDGDQVLDLVIAENLLLGRGDGTFSERAVPEVTGDPALGDLDGDGRPDIVFFADVLGVLTTTAPFRTWGPSLTRLLGNLSPAVADFTADGCLDVLGLDSAPVLLYRGDCRGHLAWPQRLAGHAVHDTATTTADFNRDGVTDVAVIRSLRRVVIRVRLTGAARRPQIWRATASLAARKGRGAAKPGSPHR